MRPSPDQVMAPIFLPVSLRIAVDDSRPKSDMAFSALQVFLTDNQVRTSAILNFCGLFSHRVVVLELFFGLGYFENVTEMIEQSTRLFFISLQGVRRLGLA